MADLYNGFLLDDNGNISKKKLAVCVATLLLEMAYVDDEFHKKEYEEVIKQLSKAYDFLDEESAETVDIVRYLRSEEPEVEGFINLVKNTYSEPQKEDIYNLILEVAIADGKVVPEEIQFSRVVREKLGLPKL